MLLKISARALMLGAVCVSLALSPVYAETGAADGQDGEDIGSPSAPATSPSTTSPGGDGEDGEGSQAGGDGGDGGAIVATVTYNNLGGVSAISEGGDGGDGGAAQQAQYEPNSEQCDDRPDLCESSPGGNGGNGGNGGDVDLTLSLLSEGDLTARSAGGRYGMAQDSSKDNGDGGNAGNVTVTVESTAIVMGNVIAESLPGKGSNVQSGEVTVTISGTVEGYVSARAGGHEESAGTIKVLLDGGVVTGLITADTSGESSLSFSFDVEDRDEFNAATDALLDNDVEGTVTINGKGYSWSGFDVLVNLLRYVGPEDKVVVKVTAETASASDSATVGEPASPPRQTKDVAKQEEEPAKPKVVAGIEVIEGKPEAAKCSGGSEIRTVRLDNGSVVVIHHNRGADTLIGQLEGGEFRRASDAPDWIVRVGDEGKTVDVSDASGTALTSCSFS